MATARHQGVIYLFEDVDTDASAPDATTGDYDAKVTGDNAEDYLGLDGMVTGDVNGDGETDLLVGSRYWESTATVSLQGAAWLIYGPLAGSYDLGSASDYDARFLGNDASDECGASVALGDLDADGAAEIIVGCSYADYGTSTGVGAVYFFAGE